MKTSFVDNVTFTLPFLGSLIPAIMTFESARTHLGYGDVEAGVIGVVVAALGFAAITTTLDVIEEYGPLSVQFAASLGGTGVYLGAVLTVNAILGDGDEVKKVAMALLALLAEVGGLMVGIRNQLMKRRVALVLADAKAEEKLDHEEVLRLQKEQDAIAYQRKLQQDEIDFQHKLKEDELQRRHERKLKVSENLQKVASEPVQVAGNEPKQPETFGKWKSWTELPEDQRLQVAEAIKQARATSEKTYKKVVAKWIMATFGVEERSAYMWIKYAERDYPTTGGEQ